MHGYNRTDGGNGRLGHHLSEETKKHLSEMRLDPKNATYGAHINDWHKKRISESRTGAMMSEESRTKMPKLAASP